MITASAPGKVVLWGEYAVLTGAPAAVLAVDRYARCHIETRAGPGKPKWRIETRGFSSTPVDCELEQILGESDSASGVIHHILRTLLEDNQAKLPVAASVMLDTQGFQHNGQKLGIGSSAAICTASYAACASLIGVEPRFEQALRTHNQFQRKPGSGIDVAAAWYGGSLRYQAGIARPLPQLEPAYWRFVWTGKPANTGSHIERFRRWIDAGAVTELEALATISHQLFDHVGSTQLPGALDDYVGALRDLDKAADLGIYSPGHERLHQLALDWQVVYKPCGAGGGDVGAAISNDADKLAAFSDAAASLGFNKLAITRADHGVHIGS